MLQSLQNCRVRVSKSYRAHRTCLVGYSVVQDTQKRAGTEGYDAVQNSPNLSGAVNTRVNTLDIPYAKALFLGVSENVGGSPRGDKFFGRCVTNAEGHGAVAPGCRSAKVQSERENDPAWVVLLVDDAILVGGGRSGVQSVDNFSSGRVFSVNGREKKI